MQPDLPHGSRRMVVLDVPGGGAGAYMAGGETTGRRVSVQHATDNSRDPGRALGGVQ